VERRGARRRGASGAGVHQAPGCIRRRGAGAGVRGCGAPAGFPGSARRQRAPRQQQGRAVPARAVPARAVPGTRGQAPMGAAAGQQQEPAGAAGAVAGAGGAGTWGSSWHPTARGMGAGLAAPDGAWHGRGPRGTRRCAARARASAARARASWHPTARGMGAVNGPVRSGASLALRSPLGTKQTNTQSHAGPA
jgi:hypothetical protein